ncbi:MAG: AAA family ATPase [Candidatus Nanoarchaeia archaeon]
MSKFYGQSLPGDEKLLVLGEEGVKRVPIEDVVNQKMEGKVACFDKKGDVIWSKIVGHIQHKRNSPLVKLTTRSGRTIKVTKDHSLFTLTKKGIESVPTSELTPGTSFVAVPKHLPEPTTTIGEINLLDLFAEHDDGVMVRGGNAYLKEAFTKIGREEAARILGVKVKYTYDIICKNVGIRVSRFVKLMDAAKIEVDPYSLWIATKGKRTRAVLSITQELCHFFGWWLAEGSYTNKNEVRLSIHSKEVDELVKLCTGLFRKTLIYRKNANSADIYICAGILGKVMKKLGFKGRGRTKTIPSIIYNLDNICLAKFISGYVSGDGSVNKKTGQIEICTESPGIADDMSYLLLRFDIVAKTYNRPGRPQKRICFGDRENLEKFLTIGFTDEKKNQIVGEVVRRTKGNRRDRVPLEALENINSSWKGLKSIGLQALTQLQALPAELEPALQGDIYWDRVISITPCEEQPEHVYDISVEPCQNFIAGFGGVFAHNSEENIRKKFEEAEKNAPSIIFIDEIDAIAAKREETRGEVEKRVVAQLLALMDGLKSRGKVVVIAATNVPNILDPALRRPGRFDREIEIGVPRYEGRLNILKIHTRNMPLENVSLDEVSRVTHGFVGADLASLAKESAMVVLRKVLPDIKYDREEAVPTEILEKLKITNSDFKEALKTVRPSAMREVLVEVPNVPWDSVGGLDYVKQELKEAVEWPLKSPQAFRRLGVNPPKGILLYGPPGTGKTLLAKAVATESEANFILVNGPQLLSKWVGESEKAVRKIFEKARQTAPSIVFFDELDALAPQRGLSQDSHVSERVVNQLLSEIDGVQVLHDIVIIGATNRPDIIDSALLRPGRFDRVIMAPVPDEKTREKIFEVHLKKMPIAEDVKAEDLAKRAEGYVGADIESICREAAIFALRKDMDSTMVTLADFEEALYKVRASVTPEIEKSYKDLEGTFKQKQGKRVIEKPAYFG